MKSKEESIESPLKNHELRMNNIKVIKCLHYTGLY